jgi:hypothetical protein
MRDNCTRHSAVRADRGEPPCHEYMLYGDGLDLLQHNPAGALDLMRMAVQLCPDGFETHNGLGRALLAMHDTAGAQAEFSVAARLAPGNDVSLRMLDSGTRVVLTRMAPYGTNPWQLTERAGRERPLHGHHGAVSWRRRIGDLHPARDGLSPERCREGGLVIARPRYA